MRQGQQNRRGRGRNNNNNNNNTNNNRKNQNPLSRSFESNGPDVKIRGTPAHIAEKYMTLARDAQSSGDHVLAENYLQHAEHYTRIIMAYREQFSTPNSGDGMNGHARPQSGEGGDDIGDDDGDDILDEGYQNAQPHAQSFQPPPQQRQPSEGNRFEGNREQQRGDARDRGDNRDRPDNRDRSDNRDGNRGDRPFRRDQGRFRDRNNNDRDNRPARDDRNQPREDRAPVREERPPVREDRPQPEHVAEAAVEPRRQPRERFQQPQHEQPDFLRRPVRRPRAESTEAPATTAKDEPRD